MPTPHYIGDRLLPAWTALTKEQQICWHFYAQKNLEITEDGDARALFGYGKYYAKNAKLLLTSPPIPLGNPPTAETPPAKISAHGEVWRKAGKLGSGGSTPTWYALLYLDQPIPNDLLMVLTQGYRRERKNPRRFVGTRHVTYKQTADSGFVDLRDPLGYFATTAGIKKYCRIRGGTAVRRPDAPLCRLYLVNTESGVTEQVTVSNPIGGTPRGIKRPKHYP